MSAKPRDVRIAERNLRVRDLTTIEGVRDLMANTAMAVARRTIDPDEARAITQACATLMDAMLGVEAMAKKRAREAAALPQGDGDLRPVNDQ